MKRIFKKVSEKANELAQLSHEEWAFRAVPHFLAELMSKYFRTEVEGLEYIPAKGSGLITANHSGFSGFDAFLLCHHIYRGLKRTPRVLTHQFWFLNSTTAIPAKKLGFIEANKQNGLDTLQNQKLLLIFPEGERGNFKPTTKAYQLQTFKRGFIRMAIETKSPIIPTLIIGAEETHINLAQLKLPKFLHELILPLPLNIIPLPARWKIKFLPPIHLKNSVEDLQNETLIRHLAEDIQDYMQIELSKEIEARKYIFL